MVEPIFVKGTRILSPEDYDRFSMIPSSKHKTIFEILFWTGMRYVELQRLYHHRDDWVMWERKHIHLPKEAMKKAKRVQLERSIHIAQQIQNILPFFFKQTAPPTLVGWHKWVKRHAVRTGFDPKGFSAKTTRKTIESWMVVAGIPLNQICLWQGHDSLTSMRHYQGLAFTDAEKDEIKRRLAGWW